MSSSLRPVLRPSALPSLPSSKPSTTYVCSQCRHARLLRRPKRPYTFTQLVTLSDGSAFTMRTTSPMPVYRSTRDTRNAPLWNPRSKELLNVEDDEAGKLSAFRARFGGGFDTQRDGAGLTGKGKKGSKEKVEQIEQKQSEQTDGEMEVDPRKLQREMKVEETKREKQRLIQQQQAQEDEVDEGWDFGEEDENMLDLISRFGQDQDTRHLMQKDAPVVKKKK